jgi:hypothetical protein
MSTWKKETMMVKFFKNLFLKKNCSNCNFNETTHCSCFYTHYKYCYDKELWQKKQFKIKTPYERLTEYHLNTFGKFSMNRMWQLESKIFNKEPLSDEEISMTRICVLHAHSMFIDSKKVKTDLRSHEVVKLTVDGEPNSFFALTFLTDVDDGKFYECKPNRFPK